MVESENANGLFTFNGALKVAITNCMSIASKCATHFPTSYGYFLQKRNSRLCDRDKELMAR